jgi:23S rRNA A2030 N6-methylase RlmJ
MMKIGIFYVISGRFNMAKFFAVIIGGCGELYKRFIDNVFGIWICHPDPAIDARRWQHFQRQLNAIQITVPYRGHILTFAPYRRQF